MTLPYDVQEAMKRRFENPPVHGSLPDDVDPAGDGDEIGVSLGYRSRHKWIQHALTGEAQVGNFDVHLAGCRDRPDGQRRFRLVAVADGTPMMDPCRAT